MGWTVAGGSFNPGTRSGGNGRVAVMFSEIEGDAEFLLAVLVAV